MDVVPHILVQPGDIIKLPGSGTDQTVKALGLIEGYLLVEDINNRFVLPRGFYLNLKDKGYLVPLMDFNGSYFHFEDDKTYDFCGGM